MEEGSEKGKSTFRLLPQGIAIHHIKSISLIKLLLDIHTIRILRELLNKFNVVLVPSCLRQIVNLCKQFQLLDVFSLVER